MKIHLYLLSMAFLLGLEESDLGFGPKFLALFSVLAQNLKLSSTNSDALAYDGLLPFYCESGKNPPPKGMKKK